MTDTMATSPPSLGMQPLTSGGGADGYSSLLVGSVGSMGNGGRARGVSNSSDKPPPSMSKIQQMQAVQQQQQEFLRQQQQKRASGAEQQPTAVSPQQPDVAAQMKELEQLKQRRDALKNQAADATAASPPPIPPKPQGLSQQVPASTTPPAVPPKPQGLSQQAVNARKSQKLAAQSVPVSEADQAEISQQQRIIQRRRSQLHGITPEPAKTVETPPQTSPTANSPEAPDNPFKDGRPASLSKRRTSMTNIIPITRRKSVQMPADTPEVQEAKQEYMQRVYPEYRSPSPAKDSPKGGSRSGSPLPEFNPHDSDNDAPQIQFGSSRPRNLSSSLTADPSPPDLPKPSIVHTSSADGVTSPLKTSSKNKIRGSSQRRLSLSSDNPGSPGTPPDAAANPDSNMSPLSANDDVGWLMSDQDVRPPRAHEVKKGDLKRGDVDYMPEKPSKEEGYGPYGEYWLTNFKKTPENALPRLPNQHARMVQDAGPIVVDRDAAFGWENVHTIATNNEEEDIEARRDRAVSNRRASTIIPLGALATPTYFPGQERTRAATLLVPSDPILPKKNEKYAPVTQMVEEKIIGNAAQSLVNMFSKKDKEEEPEENHTDSWLALTDSDTRQKQVRDNATLEQLGFARHGHEPLPALGAHDYGPDTGYYIKSGYYTPQRPAWFYDPNNPDGYYGNRMSRFRSVASMDQTPPRGRRRSSLRIPNSAPPARRGSMALQFEAPIKLGKNELRFAEIPHEDVQGADVPAYRRGSVKKAVQFDRSPQFLTNNDRRRSTRSYSLHEGPRRKGFSISTILAAKKMDTSMGLKPVPYRSSRLYHMVDEHVKAGVGLRSWRDRFGIEISRGGDNYGVELYHRDPQLGDVTWRTDVDYLPLRYDPIPIKQRVAPNRDLAYIGGAMTGVTGGGVVAGSGLCGSCICCGTTTAAILWCTLVTICCCLCCLIILVPVIAVAATV